MNKKNRLLVHTTYEDGTECFETSVHNIYMSENHPKERIQHSQLVEGLKSEQVKCLCSYFVYVLALVPYILA
jgi:hypothetical protein